MIHKKWKEGRFPGHFLYGATHLPDEGIEVVLHKYKSISSRFRLMCYVAWSVLTCREHFDAIYATHWDGLELIIFLRALHLYRRPIIIWHHQPIMEADSKFREMMARLFYKGIDHMFFFSERLIQESLKSPKANEERMQVCPWGADLVSYDRLMKEYPVEEHVGFVSTGKEKRDMPTLIRAFSATGQELNIYIAYNACGDNYVEILNDLRPSTNVHINFIKGFIPNELAQKVWAAKFVVICCQETNYTVGLTTLVEALAFGLPVISTRNETYPFDIEAEGVGITVPYYDSVAWEKAIRFLVNNPEKAEEMGRKARELAERSFNLEICAHEVAEAIKKFDKKKEKEVRGEKLEVREVKEVQEVQAVPEVPVVPEQKAVQEPTIFDVPAEPQKPEPTPEPVAPKIPEFRVSKEIEDFYADIPQTNRAVETPQPQPADKPIISINTEALKEKMHVAQEQLVKWGGIIKEQLPEKEQVVRFGKNLMQWGKKQYEKIMKKVNRK
jgi:glycosyltransferase involved in cell wall biosynthesis